jgi:hypothetical protein
MRVDKEMGKIEWERVKKRKNSRVRSLASHNSDVGLGGGVTAFLFAQIESDQHPRVLRGTLMHPAASFVLPHTVREPRFVRVTESGVSRASHE